MQLPETILENLERNLRLYEDQLALLAGEIRRQSISNYPIFVAHRETELNLGRLAIDAEHFGGDWSINASTLEEFVKRQVVHPSKLADFKQAYKSPQHFICVFVLSGNDAGFIFIPYSRQ